MRHQLSNPATFMRHLVGEQTQVLDTLMTNRLEEREVVNTVQIIRSRDVNLKPKLFTSKVESGEKNVKLTFNHLLLQEEKEIYRTNVSRKVPRRKLTLTFASLVFILWLPLFFVPFAVDYDYFGEDGKLLDEIGGLIFMIVILGLFLGIILIWIKYYSFYKASLAVTKQRIFFQDIKDPPFWLHLLGVYREVITSEALRYQVHSTYNSRQINQKLYWRAFIKHSISWLLLLILWGISTSIWVSNYELEKTEQSFRLIDSLSLLIVILNAVIVVFIAWHAANATVELIRAWPRRVFNAKGIGAHFTIPYATAKISGDAAYAIWAGDKLRET